MHKNFKKIFSLFLICCNCVFIGNPALAADTDTNTVTNPSETTNSGAVNPTANESSSQVSISRLFGNSKFETAKAISEYYNSGKTENVVLSTGIDFADALSASVLAYEIDAPILLADSSVAGSQDAFDYITQHLDPAGTIYIIGGTGIINTGFESELNNLGYKNITRIAGMDRYDTSYSIATSLKKDTAPTVVIASGEVYSDALSISSFAANQGWPILLTPQGSLPQKIQDFLSAKQPSTVFIAGGTGVISENIKSQINSLLPEASVQRFSGQSLFDTNVLIDETFAPDPTTIYLATGYDFSDALAGSIVAAKNGQPILFIDPTTQTLPKMAADYFTKLHAGNIRPNLVSFGGSGIVSDEIMKNSSDLIMGTIAETDIYSIADLAATVTQGYSYSLPTTVQAKLYDSDMIAVPVQWNSTSVNTNTIGSAVFEGVVDGYSPSVKLTLTIKESTPISQYTTYFDSSQVNRTTNVRLAANALDGTLLAPGELFSFNQRVGERTEEKGYKEAIVIEGGEFTPGIGGGVCQVSSTLYNAVLGANLEVVERHPHSLPVSYVPTGQDATVAYPTLDFKFRNSLNTYLSIRSVINDDSLTFRLFKQG